MAYDFNPFKQRGAEIVSWLNKEFTAVRTGKASPLLLDGVLVTSYGAKTPVKHIANIMVEDAKTLRITPWDRAQIKDIESAIASSNLGVSTSPDDSGVRVIFPDLTSERREALKKVIKEKTEEAKISIRKEREKVLDDINTKEKNKEISEDDKFKCKEDLQKLVDDFGAELEAVAVKKVEEISQ